MFTNVKSINEDFKESFKSYRRFIEARNINDYCVVCVKEDSKWKVFTYNCGKTVCGKNLDVYDKSQYLDEHPRALALGHSYYTIPIVCRDSGLWMQHKCFKNYCVAQSNALETYTTPQRLLNEEFIDCTAEMNKEILKERTQSQNFNL